MSYLCDLFFSFILIFIMSNRSYNLMNTDTLKCLLFFRICPIFLEDNVHGKCEYVSNSKSSALGCCLGFAWFFCQF